MTSIFTSAFALAALAASEMAGANRYYSDDRRTTSDTFRIRRGFVPYRGSIDLLGKSHGKGTSKRKRRRT